MKWFKHDSDASNDSKLKKLRLKYGAQGYGIYWYCLELIARNVEKHNLTFELEHDAELIADDFKLSSDLVQHIMTYMVDLGLFENTTGVITCLKMATRTDEYTQQLIRSNKKCTDSLPRVSLESPDNIRGIRREEKRREENRIEEKRAEKTEKHEGSRLSLLWIVPIEYLEYCKTEIPDLNPKLVAESFKDFWLGKTGADAIKNDWFVAWRKWVRNERVIINNQSSSNAWRSDLNSIYNKAKELNLNTQGKTKGELLAMIDKKQAN